VAVGGMDDRPAGGDGKDTGGQVTIHVRVPKGATTPGLHGVYFSRATAQSR